jgi:hypothetical protein
MQCDNATAQCEALAEDSSISHKPSSQSEYFTQSELYDVLSDKFYDVLNLEPMLF